MYTIKRSKKKTAKKKLERLTIFGIVRLVESVDHFILMKLAFESNISSVSSFVQSFSVVYKIIVCCFGSTFTDTR